MSTILEHSWDLKYLHFLCSQVDAFKLCQTYFKNERYALSGSSENYLIIIDKLEKLEFREAN